MILEDILTSCLLILSTIMLAISLLSYKRTRGRRLLLTSSIFTLFLVESIVVILGIFLVDVRPLISTTFFILIDLAIVILLFLGTIRR